MPVTQTITGETPVPQAIMGKMPMPRDKPWQSRL
jgi:hypothetical protein